MINIEELVSNGFYAIADKNLLLQAYEEVFHIKLCKTCTGSFITAFNALNAHVMASRKSKKNESVYVIAPHYIGGKMVIEGQSIPLASMTQEQIKKYIVDIPAHNHLLLNEQA